MSQFETSELAKGGMRRLSLVQARRDEASLEVVVEQHRYGSSRLAALAPRVLASWQRSERYGVTINEMRPAFTGSVDTDSLLYACGVEVLGGLLKTLANEPVSLLITDNQGLVLSRLSDDTNIHKSLDQVHLAPGFYFAERNAGTNGLGLALADRAPSLVRADEHFCAGLRGYTCAAAPILDLPTGKVAGVVNLTTWSDSSSALLLALAQAAAGNASALMLARGSGEKGRKMHPVPRGEVFCVYADRFQQLENLQSTLSAGWREAVAGARTAMGEGRAVAVVGESGAGKTALASIAHRGLRPRGRVLNARPPAPDDVEPWLTLWTPELGKPDTHVIVSGVDTLPAWAAAELARLVARVRGADGTPPLSVTAECYTAIPDPLSRLVDTVVEVPALRERSGDVLPLAHYFAQRERGRPVTITRTAARVLTGYDWPENVKQLRRVVREAAARTDAVDGRHLPPEVFTASGRRRLSRLETLERDEIVRCLTEPGTTVAQAAAKLGVGRATIYRKMSQYDIKLPGRGQVL